MLLFPLIFLFQGVNTVDILEELASLCLPKLDHLLVGEVAEVALPWIHINARFRVIILEGERLVDELSDFCRRCGYRL